MDEVDPHVRREEPALAVVLDECVAEEARARGEAEPCAHEVEVESACGHVHIVVLVAELHPQVRAREGDGRAGAHPVAAPEALRPEARAPGDGPVPAGVELRPEVPVLVVAGRDDDARRELELFIQALELVADLELRLISGIQLRREIDRPAAVQQPTGRHAGHVLEGVAYVDLAQATDRRPRAEPERRESLGDVAATDEAHPR